MPLCLRRGSAHSPRPARGAGPWGALSGGGGGGRAVAVHVERGGRGGHRFFQRPALSVEARRTFSARLSCGRTGGLGFARRFATGSGLCRLLSCFGGSSGFFGRGPRPAHPVR